MENNIWKRWCLRSAVMSLYRNHPIDMQSKSVGLLVCNSNTGLKWQGGCMVKVNINL